MPIKDVATSNALSADLEMLLRHFKTGRPAGVYQAISDELTVGEAKRLSAEIRTLRERLEIIERGLDPR